MVELGLAHLVETGEVLVGEILSLGHIPAEEVGGEIRGLSAGLHSVDEGVLRATIGGVGDVVEGGAEGIVLLLLGGVMADPDEHYEKAKKKTMKTKKNQDNLNKSKKINK